MASIALKRPERNRCRSRHSIIGSGVNSLLAVWRLYRIWPMGAQTVLNTCDYEALRGFPPNRRQWIMSVYEPNCNDPEMLMGLWQGRRGSDAIQNLFADRRVAYAFQTRVAIRRACDVLGLKPGDEVLAPGYNCGSELDPLRNAGIKIRLYPITPTAEIDPDAVARMIGPQTRAIYLTHYFGIMQPQATAIRTLCDVNGLRMIEDCALSLLSGLRPVDGRLGDVSVFCFYKFFPVMGGGALVVNATDLPPPDVLPRSAPTGQVIKSLLRGYLGKLLGPDGVQDLKRRIGRNKEQPETDDEGKSHPDMPGYYYFAPDLTNRRISGLTTRALSSVDIVTAIADRRRNYLRMLERLDSSAGLQPLFPVLPADATPLSMPIRVRKYQRNALVNSLKAAGIPATAWWSGYNRFIDFTDVPDSCALKDSVLSLPMHQYLDLSAINHITDRVNTLARQKA